MNAEQFLHELNVQLRAPQGGAKDIFHLGGWFTNVLKSVIDSVGLGDMTKEEFLAMVATAYDAITISMGIPPLLSSLMKGSILFVAGKIYDKRHSTPVPAV